LDEDVAWLVGLFHADGYVRVTSSSGELSICLTGDESEQAIRAAAIFERFGVAVSISEPDEEFKYVVRVKSKQLAMYFAEHIKNKKEIRVPAFIKGGSALIRASYIQGVTDGDGCVCNRPSQVVVTICREFARDVQAVLASLGIISRMKPVFTPNGWSPKYAITIINDTDKQALNDLSRGIGWKKHIVHGRPQHANSFPMDWYTKPYPRGWYNKISPQNDGVVIDRHVEFFGPTTMVPTEVLDVVEGRDVETIDLEVEDSGCFVADGVLVHNSAEISLSNPSDDRMRYAKSGNWQQTAPWRYMANMSACYTEKPGMDVFMREWLSLYDSKSGERGIFNREAAKKQVLKYGRRDPNHEWGCNPCSEIILRSNQFCNLSEVIVRKDDTEKTLKRKVRLATIIGTMQATLTHFIYLNSNWKKNTEEEALLGVSLTGVMDNELMSGVKGKVELKEVLTKLREHAVAVNKEWAAKLGINPAAAITCCKPSGCITLDTRIKTDRGFLSLAEIFDLNGVSPIGLCSDTWIEPTVPLKVFDRDNHQQQVTKLYVNGMAEVFEVEDENGQVFKFTGNHKLLTTTGWKRIDELTIEDEIVSFE
jgi:hypothetical protein